MIPSFGYDNQNRYANDQQARHAMEYMTPVENELQYRKALGRSHLSGNRLAEAIEMYSSIIRDYPQDVEAYLVLGDLYLAGEDSSAALALYKKARSLSPENVEIINRIKLAEAEQSENGIRVNPQDEHRIIALIEQLNGKKSVQEDDVEKATNLLQEIIHSSNPADLVSSHLDQIDTLLPALLELNIRQAKAERRPDLVQGLESIKDSIGSDSTGSFAPDEMMPAEAESFSRIESVTFLVPDEHNISTRIQFIKECLLSVGAQVSILSSTDAAQKTKPQLVIAFNPHTSPWLLEYMAECAASKVPVILDLDSDYEQIPLNHPDYIQKGLGLPANARAYTAALLLSNLITTPSVRFAEQMTRSGYKALPIPDGWCKSNYLWEKSLPKRPTINIGWIGSSGMLDDLLEIRRILIRVVREFPRTQLVIAENSNAFQLFESLPENRKLFLPEVSQEDYPYLLGQLDILAVPLRNIPFNFTHSDTILMEAGIKRLPWIASRLPAMVEWNAGGLMAASLDEWHTDLRQLVMDEELRHKLGEAGNQKAMTREINQVKRSWMDAMQQAMRDPLNRGFLTTMDKQPQPAENE
jgi:tetratricopeptide (TPR) repeat protein